MVVCDRGRPGREDLRRGAGLEGASSFTMLLLRSRRPPEGAGGGGRVGLSTLGFMAEEGVAGVAVVAVARGVAVEWRGVRVDGGVGGGAREGACLVLGVSGSSGSKELKEKVGARGAVRFGILSLAEFGFVLSADTSTALSVTPLPRRDIGVAVSKEENGVESPLCGGEIGPSSKLHTRGALRLGKGIDRAAELPELLSPSLTSFDLGAAFSESLVEAGLGSGPASFGSLVGSCCVGGGSAGAQLSASSASMIDSREGMPSSGLGKERSQESLLALEGACLDGATGGPCDTEKVGLDFLAPLWRLGIRKRCTSEADTSHS